MLRGRLFDLLRVAENALAEWIVLSDSRTRNGRLPRDSLHSIVLHRVHRRVLPWSCLRQTVKEGSVSHQSVDHVTLLLIRLPLVPLSQSMFTCNSATHGIILPQQHPPLTMPQHTPRNPTVHQLLHTNLARERPIRLIKHILRRHLDALPEVLAAEQQVKRRRGDDDFDGRVGFGGREVRDNVPDLLDGAVHFEVAADEELARHGCG